MTNTVTKIADEQWEAQLPVPVGYRLLVALPDIDDHYEGTSLLKTDTEKHREYIMSIMGVVIDMGADAYSDKERFPEGPWCKVGDYVMFRMNTGTRFKVNGKEFRLMNDDSVEAVIPDPRGIMTVQEQSMPFQKVEFEFPDEKEEESTEIEVEPSSAEEIKKPARAKAEEADSLEIEVVDDTPKADRGRKPSEPPEDVTEEELEDYSEKVQKRIKHFSKGYHDERREKERAIREREELERFAKQLVEENNKLKGDVTKNQTALVEQAKKNAEAESDAAKQAYKAAYESGDSDAVLSAQDKLTAAKIKADRLANFKIPTLQETEVPVPSKTESAPQTGHDPRAEEWKTQNPWFNVDDEMTSLALGLHNKLIKEGVSPQSDEYYERIDSRMRQVFPDSFEDADQQTEVTPKRSANVVAPATRSTAPKKVKLSQTQIALSRRLGLTPEQYARQVALDMRKQNG